MRASRLIAVAVAALLVAACTEGDVEQTTEPTSAATEATSPDAGTADPSETISTEPTIPSDGSVVSQFAGEDWFAGTVPAAATAADETLEPVVIGMINQENSPVGSFPELRASVQAAVEWINTELGGVNGRPLELIPCITSFSPEQSAACAQDLVEAGAVAVISGIDITSSASVPILEQNQIPMISAIPTTLAEMRSTNAFTFSGGVTGAYVAFADDAARNGATKLAIAYGQFESFEVPATQYGAKVAEDLGLEVALVPFPITTTDFAPVLQGVIDSGADAVAIGAADTACAPIMTGLSDLGYEGRVYLVGACAAEQIISQVPDDVQAGIIFNSEGPTESTTEGALFQAVVDRYATEPAGGAGTVSIRSVMNLWRAMTSLSGEVAPAAIAEQLRSGTDNPSYWGHPYTCDGAQVPGFPSMCSPQQTLFRLPDDSGTPEAVSDGWIDVPALVAGLTG